ncbi:MAG: MFS transporter [Bdellovibrionales bacterium]|nr:MFS transporter [Bdellovibrionales bacterium]
MSNEITKKDFLKLIYSRFFLTLAVQMQAVVIGWRVYDLTKDPLSLGIVGLCEAVPALGLALYAGYFVDHHHPIKTYRGVVLGSLFSGLILLFSSRLHGDITVSAQILSLYSSSFFTGVARSFSQPSTFAIVPKLIPRESLAKAQAWMGSIIQSARVIGPALGGVAFGFLGIVRTAEAICALLLLSFMFSFHIETLIEPALKVKKIGKMRADLVEGARFVFKHKILFPALSLDMISVLFGGVTALLPIYAQEVLMVGPKGLGLLRASPAIGATLMGVYLAKVSLKQQAGKWLLTSVAGFGVCILVFALSKNFVLSFIALGLSGAFDNVSAVIRSTVVQLLSPDHLRGRISSVNSMFIGSSNELGELESGLVAKMMGTIPAAVFGGVMCLLTVLLVTLKSSSLRKLDLEALAKLKT